MFFKKAYNAGQIFQNLHFRQNFICESNAENFTQAEISSFDCKNTQNRGLKARFEYEFEIPQMSFKALCVECVSVKRSILLNLMFFRGVENRKVTRRKNRKIWFIFRYLRRVTFRFSIPPENHQIKQNGPQSSLKLICGISNSYSKRAFKPLFWVFLQSRLEISACVEFSAFDSQMKFCRKWRFWKILPAL